MSHEIAGFGPSLVDVCAEVNQEVYDACREYLDIEPGGWKRLSDYKDMQQLLGIIVAGETAPDIDLLERQPNVSLVAGSSILGMFGAMNPGQREHAHLVTAAATKNGAEDSFSSFFHRTVTAIGVNHMPVSIEGPSPVGVVLHTPSNRDKILAMYPGVATQIDKCEQLELLNPEYLFVDAYELQESQLADLLESLILSEDYRVALSLGNHSIMNGDLKQRVRKFVDGGYITVLCGNSLEYEALFDELEADATTVDGFEQHPVKDLVAFSLLTRGPQQISTHWDGAYYSCPSYPLEESLIVNTSGAGDTAMGVYCAGVIEGMDAEEALAKAAYMATHVLRKTGSMIIAAE